MKNIYNYFFYRHYSVISLLPNDSKPNSGLTVAYISITELMNVLSIIKLLLNGSLGFSFLPIIGFILFVNYQFFLKGDKYWEIQQKFMNENFRNKVAGAVLLTLYQIFTYYAFYLTFKN